MSTILGIRARLFLAFGVLAAFTAIASAIAWWAFSDIGRSVTRVTHVSVPSMVASLRLAEISAEITATAPSIMASDSQETRVREKALLDQRAQALTEMIANLETTDVDSDIVLKVSGIADDIVHALSQLNHAVEQRLFLQSLMKENLESLSLAHTNILFNLEPVIDDAIFNLIISGEYVMTDNSRSIADLVEVGVGTLDHLLNINAEGNLAAGLLAEASHIDSIILLQPIKERFLSAAASIDSNLQQLPDSPEKPKLEKATAALLAHGRDRDNVFSSQIRSLDSTSGGTKNSNLDQDDFSAALNRTHESFLSTLIPMIDDAAFNLVISTDTVAESNISSVTNLIDVGVNSLYMLLTIQAEGNLAAGLLNEAASSSDTSQLLPLEERYTAAKGQISMMLKSLPGIIDVESFDKEIFTLLDFGTGNDSIFVLRRDELDQIKASKEALDASQNLSVDLANEIALIVADARRHSDAAATDSGKVIERGQLLMLVLSVFSLLGATAVIVFYVGPRIIEPLNNITEAMTQLAAGDTSVDIPGRDRGDELGRMAKSLGVFRDTAIEVQNSNMEEIRTTRRRLSDAIESISEGFSLYDSDDRLTVCNSKYKDLLYPDMADEIKPGMTFTSIIRSAANKGYIKDSEGRIEEWVNERLAQHCNPEGSHIQQRGDGRWIMVSERKTDDGGTVAVYSDITELKLRETELSDKSNELEQLSNQLSKYLSPQVYDSIFTGRQEVKLASQRKKLTVFFSDIAGFTETADKLESEDLTQLLNHYLTEMSKIALEHGATIDKYVGDAIVIFFGDPETKGVKEDAMSCVRMAIAMRKRLNELQSAWLDSGIEQPLVCRIGINTGYCTVGNFGSEDRMDYTIIGGGVNLASRLESTAAPGEINISYETYALIKGQIMCEEGDTIKVKGIAYPVSTYRVIDTYSNLDASDQVIREDHPNIKLNLDLGAMSLSERNKVADTLQRVLKQIKTTK